MKPKKAIPMICLTCKNTPGSYYGRLVFPQELAIDPEIFNIVAEGGGSIADPGVPECPNHEGSDLTFPLTAVNTSSRRVLRK